MVIHKANLKQSFSIVIDITCPVIPCPTTVIIICTNDRDDQCVLMVIYNYDTNMQIQFQQVWLLVTMIFSENISCVGTSLEYYCIESCDIPVNATNNI